MVWNKSRESAKKISCVFAINADVEQERITHRWIENSRTRQEKVAENSSRIERPQAFARISVEIEDILDGTPRKKSRIGRDDVNKESNENRNNWKVCFGVGYQQ
ncbi:hypothetical protein Tco_1555247 [Tanacetum coccineum]